MEHFQVKVDISPGGDRIFLKSEYFQGINNLCKMVPGYNFRKQDKIWTYPLTMPTCRALRRVFGNSLAIMPNLAEWAWEARRSEEHMRALTKMSDYDLRRVPELLPAVADAMSGRTYQRVGAAFMAASARGGVLLADQPGLGKTIQTLAGIVERGIEVGSHLVACPATAVRIVWEKEIRKWTGFSSHAAVGSAKNRQEVIREFIQDTSPTKFLIVNPEMLMTKLDRWCSKCKQFVLDMSTEEESEHFFEAHKDQPKVYKQKFLDLFAIEWSSIVVDESHRFLNGVEGPNKKTQVGEGLCRLNLAPGGLRIALSGTPIKGRPRNFWGVLHWLDPKKYTSKWTWAETFLDIDDNGFGKTINGVRPECEEEFYRSLDEVMLRRTKAEVAPDLPQKEVVEHWIEPSKKQLRQYQEMKSMGEALFGNTMVTATGALAELTRLKQIATAYQVEDGPVMSESCKWTYLMDMLQDRGVVGPKDEREGTDKYVIASQFTQVIDAMEQEFQLMGVDVLKITGAVSGRNRIKAQNAFQTEGGPRVILINTMAGGVAIDLDNHCDELFFMDETWVPDDQEQVEDRIHRVSRIHRVTIHYLFSKGSIDEVIAACNYSKEEIQKQILDGRRGVEFARNLLRKWV